MAPERVTHHDQVGFLPGMQEWLDIQKSINALYHVNRMKEKKLTIITTEAEKALDKNPTPFHYKTFNQVGVEGNFPKPIKGIH